MLKRLIEVALPLKEVSEHSAREKSIRHGHISTLHIWWARRPLAACRAAVFASLIPDPDDPECPEEFRKLVMDVLGKNQFQPKNSDGSSIEDTPRNRCLEFIKHLIRWENSNNPDYIDPARKLIAAAHKFLHPDAEGDAPRVLDPFAGGGSIPLEALRLGCEAHAIDLNPVAHLIELCTLVYPQKYGQPNSRPVPDYIKRLVAENRAKRKTRGEDDLFDKNAPSTVLNDEAIPDVEISESEYRHNPLASDVRYWASWVREAAHDELSGFYKGINNDAEPVAFLWARTFRCPNPTCGCEVPLLQTRAVQQNGDSVTLITTNYKKDNLHFGLETVRNPTKEQLVGTMSRNSCACPNCQTVIHKSDLERIGKSIGFGQQMMCVVETEGQGKKCRLPTEDDHARYEASAHRFAEAVDNPEDDVIVPDGDLPNSVRHNSC